MPIYEYQCRECGHRLEALQKISDSPLKTCPACQHDGLSKLVSASSFRLKGGGWYETDFKTGNRRHGAQDSAKVDAAKADSPGKGKETGSAAGGGSATASGSAPASPAAKPSTTGSGG